MRENKEAKCLAVKDQQRQAKKKKGATGKPVWVWYKKKRKKIIG